MMRDEAWSEWRVPKQLALLLFVAPFAGWLIIALSRLSLPLFRFITAEDRLLEWLQFVGYAATVVVALVLARRLWGSEQRLYAVAFLAVAVGAFFVAGEEITWGQRILGIETPESFDSLNRQGEIGIHNLYSVETAFNLAMLAIGLYGSVIAWAIRMRRSGPPSAAVSLFVPPLFLTSAFFIVFLHRLVRFTVPDVTSITTFVKLGEWPEFCLAWALVVFCALNLRRLSAADAAEAQPPSPSAAAV